MMAGLQQQPHTMVAQECGSAAPQRAVKFGLLQRLAQLFQHDQRLWHKRWAAQETSLEVAAIKPEAWVQQVSQVWCPWLLSYSPSHCHRCITPAPPAALARFNLLQCALSKSDSPSAAPARAPPLPLRLSHCCPQLPQRYLPPQTSAASAPASQAVHKAEEWNGHPNGWGVKESVLKRRQHFDLLCRTSPQSRASTADSINVPQSCRHMWQHMPYRRHKGPEAWHNFGLTWWL